MESPFGTASELYEDIVNGNDLSSRTNRLNQLNMVKNRLAEIVSRFQQRGKGPSDQEMEGVLADLERHVDWMRSGNPGES
ncbi:MAG: hypothetical protein OXI71_14065 [Gemmatimonadota bacterium]|nr:hypothetical protein [Gemmatimonadota bacterium]